MHLCTTVSTIHVAYQNFEKKVVETSWPDTFIYIHKAIRKKANDNIREALTLFFFLCLDHGLLISFFNI